MTDIEKSVAVKGNALRVSEPLRKYHHSEGWEKISERATEKPCTVLADIKWTNYFCKSTCVIA